MKKGNRVLALFLAVILVVTGITWDFSNNVAVVNADTATTTRWLQPEKINFDNIDVTTLEEKGYTSTRYNRADGNSAFAQVEGEVDINVSKHWFSGTAATVEGKEYTSSNAGIKPIGENNDNRYYLNTPYKYENFKATAEITYGYYAGIVLGKDDVSPSSKSGVDSSIAVFVSNNTLYVYGAIDQSVHGAKYKSTAFSISSGTRYTLTVEKMGNTLTVKANDTTLTVTIADTYESGRISLMALKYTGDGGGFRTLTIQNSGHVEFDDIDISGLEREGYTSTRYNRADGNSAFAQVEGEVDINVSKHWFSGTAATVEGKEYTSSNAGIKPIGNNDNNRYYLNTPYKYENFKATTEITYGYYAGIVLGKDDVSPSSKSGEDSSIAVFVSNNKLYVYGAIDQSVHGGKNVSTTFNISGGTKYTLTVEKMGDTLTVKANNTTLTVTIADTYESGRISLMALKYTGDGGGFRTFAIQNLDYMEFDNIAVSDLEKIGYTSTRYNRANSSSAFAQVDGEVDIDVSKHWFSGTSATVEGKTYTSSNAGIKPIGDNDNNRYYLNTPYKYENFKATTEITYGYYAGIVLGKDDVSPSSKSGEDSSIAVFVSNNKLYVYGAIDQSVHGAKSVSTAFNISGGTKYILTVEKMGNTLTVKANDTMLTVTIADTYKSGRISLMALKHTGDGGGFRTFTIEELSNNATNEGTEVDIDRDGARYTNFDNVQLSLLEEKGFTSTRYNRANSSSAFAQVEGEIDINASKHWFSGTAATVEGKAYTSSNAGIKPIGENDDNRYYLNTPYKYENFKVTTEITYGYYAGVVLGKDDVSPSSRSGVDSSIAVFVSNNKLYVYGAIDQSVHGAKNVSTTFNISGGTKYILTVEKTGDTLTVKANDTMLTVTIADTYESGRISLMALKYTGDGGGFRTFTIEELTVTDTDTGTGTEVDVDKDGTRYTNFDNVKLSLLNEKGFTSTGYNRADSNSPFVQVDGAIDTDVSKHWTSESGLKTKANSSENRYYLNTPYTYENFKISTDVYLGQTVGLALGEGTASPSNRSGEDTSVVVYFYNNHIYICGAVDTTDRIVTGTNGASSSLSGKTILFTFDKTYQMTKKEVKTLNVEMLEGILTIWVDGYDGKISVPVTEKYQSGNIALLAQKSSEGGFKTFSIQELQASQQDDANNFESMQQVEEMFDAYYLKNAKESSKMEKVNIDDHWSLSYRGILSRKTSSTGYTVTDDVEVLTYTQREFTDFEMTYTYQQNWLRLGVAIGEDLGEYPLSYTNGKLTADKGAVVFFEAEGYSNVQGHLNNTNNKESLLYRVKEPTPDGFQDVSSNISARKLHTVKIVVKDKALYIFLDGSEEPACYTHLGDNYKGGYVSLIAHAPSGYGFKNFAITDKITTTLPLGGGVSVSGNTVTVDFNSTKFDDSNFETYYLAKTKQNADGIMEKQDFEDQWTIDNGVLESNNKLPMPGSDNLTEFEYDDAAMVSVLTYNKKMTNFIATYDYQKTPRRMMFMFGTEMGKYALAAQNTTERGQGVVIYPENDLGTGGGIVALGNLATYTSSMRPSARTKVYVDGYHEAGKWASNVGTWHTMTVAVIDGHCYIYLDDYGMIADYELSDYEGGYISLATTGRGASFDNLKITDLSTLSENDIIAGENPSDITVLVGTDASALGLPTSVKATTKTGKTVDVPVTWKSLNYNASEAGVYQFTAVLDDKTNVGVKINVRVVTEMPKTQSGVKYWTFDTEDDLKDFKAYYLKNAETGYITENVPNWYVNSSGRLTRDPFRAVNGDQYKEIAILTYAGEKYTNFELEVEYTQQWQRMMVLFGSEKVGQYIDLKDIYAASNPVAGFVEMEGVRNFIGNLINANFDSNDKEKINNARESGIRLENYYDKVLYGGNQGKKHTMKIRVVGDQAMMWVDNAEVPYVCTLTNYDGGYISLVATSKSGSFDNLKITRLNAKGEPEPTDPNAVANGTMNVSIDATASTELVVPEKVKPESYEDILIDGEKEVVIPTIAYVVGGSTILLAIIIGSLFILAALKKKKKES